MKLIISTLSALLFTGAYLSAQMPGMMTMQPSAPEGTALGANTTSGSAGIALGNRVVMRGYVDFIYQYDTESEPSSKIDPVTGVKTYTDGPDSSDFSTTSDIDFLFDFSPVTAEVHLAMDPNPAVGADQIGLEQAFGRYSFNRDFHITFGRQLTSLGFDDDEAPGLYTTSGTYQNAGTGVHQGYNDGVRANFNNGRFGFILGLYDGYWSNNNFNDDKVGIDVGASLMIVPGLEYRIGYAHNGVDNVDPITGASRNDNITQFNTWLSYNPGALTLAVEYDKYDKMGKDIADVMLLANYQFSDLIAASIRYVYEDVEEKMNDSDRISLALLFSITQNFGLNLEYSHWAINAEKDYSINQLYIEGLITF